MSDSQSSIHKVCMIIITIYIIFKEVIFMILSPALMDVTDRGEITT